MIPHSDLVNATPVLSNQFPQIPLESGLSSSEITPILIPDESASNYADALVNLESNANFKGNTIALHAQNDPSLSMIVDAKPNPDFLGTHHDIAFAAIIGDQIPVAQHGNNNSSPRGTRGNTEASTRSSPRALRIQTVGGIRPTNTFGLSGAGGSGDGGDGRRPPQQTADLAIPDDPIHLHVQRLLQTYFPVTQDFYVSLQNVRRALSDGRLPFADFFLLLEWFSENPSYVSSRNTQLTQTVMTIEAIINDNWDYIPDRPTSFRSLQEAYFGLVDRLVNFILTEIQHGDQRIQLEARTMVAHLRAMQQPQRASQIPLRELDRNNYITLLQSAISFLSLQAPRQDIHLAGGAAIATGGHTIADVRNNATNEPTTEATNEATTEVDVRNQARGGIAHLISRIVTNRGNLLRLVLGAVGAIGGVALMASQNPLRTGARQVLHGMNPFSNREGRREPRDETRALIEQLAQTRARLEVTQEQLQEAETRGPLEQIVRQRTKRNTN